MGTGGGEAEEEGLDVDTQLSTSGSFLREGSDASLRDRTGVEDDQGLRWTDRWQG